MFVLSILISDVVIKLCSQFDKYHMLQHVSLNTHWAVLIPANIFIGIVVLFVMTATFEFI